MNSKNKILEAWIMVEHLSEGNINLQDKTVKTLGGLQEENYYKLLKEEIQKSRFKSYRQFGIVVYFDVFSFNEVIKFLREKYHLSPSGEEISIGDKFSFALYFDKELKLNGEMTFFTESYYIRNYKKVPKEIEFTSFEEENKKYIEELFECTEDVDYEKYFNKAINKLLKKYIVDIKQCRMKVLSNMETDAANLHSFFVRDLEKAKSIKTSNLDVYLLGKSIKRIDLDCKAESGKFNPEIIYSILQPCNYPLSRFPSNTQFALSLMQQVAVNLATKYDNEPIRSVNGPPGTGKTTLLRDIFAELVVEQAVEIARMSNKVIKGSNKTRYYENASIGQMPSVISEKGIVVASSNNGAVQNIVNELPLLSEISGIFVDEICRADYFREIANTTVSTEWVKDKNGKLHEELRIEKNQYKDKFWGLFSLEGGKKANMEYIVTVLKHVVNYLENEYIPDKEIYTTFIKKYEKVCSFRKERQDIADIYSELHRLSQQLEEKKNYYSTEETKKSNSLRETIDSISNDRNKIKTQMEGLDEELHKCMQQAKKIADDKERINQCIQALKLQKPCFFARRIVKAEYKKKLKDYSDQLILIIEEERQSKRQETEIEYKKQEYNRRLLTKTQDIEDAQRNFDVWRQESQNNINKLQEQVDDCKNKLRGAEINKLNMGLDYDELQKSNPWFDEEYRIIQSQLFITALKVRKQFLYENRKNVKAAYIIWKKQNDYLSNKIIISEAWNWINMVIPVISSTFASFARMCANLEKETLGHLFVDEAGQALPQASVGAIFRSRYVMVVGDPAQIKPVLTLDSSILRMLGEHFGVSSKYLSDSASTQTLVDEISQYGFYKNAEEWIGIPLWVHRRCKNPMFSIANKISYGGNMVLDLKGYGKAKWYDICGSAYDKYVKEQGEFLREKISEMIRNNPDIIDKSKQDVIYVISPFKNVAFQLSQELKKINFTRYDENGKPTNIGTVHTFQGKEAPIVFMVLGADSKSIGAANWAVGTENPNIMNVAATRAKEEFYIIGDKKLYMSLNSDVINDTYKIISQFNAEK